LELQVYENSAFRVNSYLAVQEDECIIIDPGEEFSLLEKAVTEQGLNPLAILNTHGHVDHIAGVVPLQKRYNIPFCLHAADRYLLDHHEQSCANYGLYYAGTPDIDHDLSGQNEIIFGSIAFRILHTPGHTPGGVCLLAGNEMLTGDTLFFRSIGRTDFPGGDHAALQNSIRSRLYSLPASTRIHPGHGPVSRIGDEMRMNPFTRS